MEDEFDNYYIKCEFCREQDLRTRCQIIYWDKKEYHTHCFIKKLMGVLNELPKEYKKLFNTIWKETTKARNKEIKE